MSLFYELLDKHFINDEKKYPVYSLAHYNMLVGGNLRHF